MESLNFELPVGLMLGADVHKAVELLKTNGVAEKVFTKRISDKPFTWQGNIIAIAVGSIGDIQIGTEVRKKYLEDGTVTIPNEVLSLTLADTNTLLVEIHRRTWVSKIPNQEIICKYCGKKLIAEIDLDKIDYLPETKKQMELSPNYREISINLKDGFIPSSLGKITEQDKYAGITSTEYNRVVFRPPLLSDAIHNEKYFSDSIGFWRRIALDCMVAIQRIENDEVIDTLPAEFHTWYGLRLFNEFLSGYDLRNIRKTLLEFLPTLPFAYYQPCGCDEARDIPMVMDASNFFSE